MSKPEKYLVVSRQNVIAMYNRIIEEQVNGGHGAVVLKCEMSSKKYPGQLRMTDTCSKSLYPYWPRDDDEVFKVEGAV